MTKAASWAPAPNLTVLKVEQEDLGWAVSVNSRGDAACPICATRYSSRHGSYIWSLQDLPAQGKPVMVQARVTRWRCRNDQYERGTFAARQADLTPPFARRTTRIAGMVRLVGHSAGGRPSERLLARLGMPVGHTTILRHVKQGARNARAPIRVAGINDRAWNKGTVYGTVVVDLEQRQVVDVLTDRAAHSTAEWFPVSTQRSKWSAATVPACTLMGHGAVRHRCGKSRIGSTCCRTSGKPSNGN